MKNFKKYLVLLLASLIMLLPFSSVSSAETPHVRFAVLGDSIASGYGLENIYDCYAAIISAEKSYYLTNDAVPGHTTQNLLNVLCNSSNARTSVSNADVISVSIGGNDLIQLLTNAKDNPSVMMDIYFNGVNATVVKEAKQQLIFNLEGICYEIRLLNPDAPIIFQTLYNPLYANEQYSSYASFAEMFVPLMEEIMNDICKKYENVFVADVYSAFDSYYEETGKYDIIHPDGIHPSVKGHKLIAKVITDKINELEKSGLIPAPALFYYLLGDADGNQKITVSDATTIQKSIAGILSFAGDVAKLCLDANEDKSVNIKDATAIQKHLADLESNPNIGQYLPFYEN